MSEHVDVERSEAALFLLDWVVRRDPWGKSGLGEGFLLGALPQGSGGRMDEGEPENTSAPRGLQLRIGMGLLGATGRTAVGDGLGGHPLGTRTQRGTSSEMSEKKEPEGGEEKD